MRLILSAVVGTAVLAVDTTVVAADGFSEVWVAVVGGVVAIATVIANLIVSLRNSRKADDIKAHTNSIISTLQSSLRDATTRAELLERLIKTRELGAAAQVVAVDKAVSAALAEPDSGAVANE